MPTIVEVSCLQRGYTSLNEVPSPGDLGRVAAAMRGRWPDGRIPGDHVELSTGLIGETEQAEIRECRIINPITGQYYPLREEGDSRLPYAFAAKKLKNPADDYERWLRTSEEAEAMVALPVHPNLVRLVGTSQKDRDLYIIMELLPGLTLRELERGVS